MYKIDTCILQQIRKLYLLLKYISLFIKNFNITDVLAICRTISIKKETKSLPQFCYFLDNVFGRKIPVLDNFDY